MIRLEQIRLLEERVNNVVARLREMKNENRRLRDELAQAYEKVTRLEKNVDEYVNSQSEIEAGILSALERLDSIEDDVVADDGVVVNESESPTEAPAKTESAVVEEDPEVEVEINLEDDPGSEAAANADGEGDEVSVEGEQELDIF